MMLYERIFLCAIDLQLIVMGVWFTTTREMSHGTSTTTSSHSRNKRGSLFVTYTGDYGVWSTPSNASVAAVPSSARTYRCVPTTHRR